MTIAAQCYSCIKIFKSIASCDTDPDDFATARLQAAVSDELARLSLWIGNIGALHPPGSPMSLEKRLEDGQDLLKYASSLLEDLEEVASELLDLVSGPRDNPAEAGEPYCNEAVSTSDSDELLQEIGKCLSRLYKMTTLVRQAAPTDRFAKALSRNRYFFNEQYDIAHVGEKFPRLATADLGWLRERFGRAISQRRRYLSYIQDHRDKLEGMLHRDEQAADVDIAVAAPATNLPVTKSAQLETASRPSTHFTKATTVAVEQIAPAMLVVDNDTDLEDDAKSYTTISRSQAGDLDISAAIKVPKLEDLRTGTRKEVECPFCFQIKRFRNERTWRRHVFADLRTYVCTFPNCNSPYFGDINDWFRHEMDNHRVSYSCQLCSQKSFRTGGLYLSHIRQKHPALLLAGDEQIVLSIARNPLEQLNAQDCPCCTDWPDRLRSRASIEEGDLASSSDLVYVAPNLFKRHLASHLEQLALFAVPIPHGSTEEEVKSMIAIGDDRADGSHIESQSLLTFSSRSQSSSTKSVPIVDLNSVNDISEVLRKLLNLVNFGRFANLATAAAAKSEDAFSRRLRTRAAHSMLTDVNLQKLANDLHPMKYAPDHGFEDEARNLLQSLGDDQDAFKKSLARVLLDACQWKGDVPVDQSGATMESPPDSPASSYDGPPSLISTVDEESLSFLPLKDPAGTLGVPSLEPDHTPYPTFLQPKQAARLDGKWHDLDWTQMNRLRDGMISIDTEQPTQWARCSGEPFAPRNRYMNVDPYQANRVRLKVPEDADDYINASPIELLTTRTKTRLRYIATQGPKADSWSHIWRMVSFETKSPAVIVMLTKTHEQGREKCYPYFPRTTSEPALRVNEHDEFGDGFVSDLRLIELSHHDKSRTEVREIAMIKKANRISEADEIGPKKSDEVLKVWHLLFEGWPDFSVPEGSAKPAVLELVKLAREKNNAENPIVVHCSAGIGRTGTFIALDWLIHELQEGSLDDLSEHEDPILTCIGLLRDQRPMMVQSKQQFIFLYDILREQWRKRWVELHPEEALARGITYLEEEEEEPSLKRAKRNMLVDGPDVSFVGGVERAKLEAELLGADYERQQSHHSQQSHS